MIRYFFIATAALLAGPATAQTISGCGATAISKAESAAPAKLTANADCFARAKAVADAAERTRRSRLAALAPPTPTPVVTPTPTPTSAPAPPPAAQPMTVTPIASEFVRADQLWTGFPIPASMAPDVVGAFRFICAPGQVNRDDPILYPGVAGGSPHPHQWYGNLAADYRSTYANLRTSGDSTCGNKLNRSAYWVPVLMNAAGMMIRPDYLAIYYKRHRDGDPACLLEAAKGCADLPTGLRVVSGYDTRRMGEKQPENSSFNFRCISSGKPSVHRNTLAEAVTDCGGAGQIMAAIYFGDCWDGNLDSPDHRSHLRHGSYIGHSYAECPASHPYQIPELTQQIAYTIAATDGAIYFASDKMNGMDMPGGATFHADYMEGWDPLIRETWHRNCIGKMLNCSDGVLGDGSMMKRGLNPSLANPRLVEAPGR